MATLLLGALAVAPAFGQGFAGHGNGANALLLWYGEPAEEWTEALPLGNGTLGAMVFGGVSHERLQINESTIWTGQPRTYAHPGASSYLGQIRELLQQMRIHERSGNSKEARLFQTRAEDLALKEFMSDPLRLMKYQPCADLYLDFHGHDKFVSYRRELDLRTGLSTVSYTCAGVRFTRESFASYPDQCIVTRISADKPGAVSFKASLESPHENWEIHSTARDGLVLSGRVADGVIRFAVHVLIDVSGGEISEGAKELEVVGADSATIKLVAATNFRDYRTVDRVPAARCLELLGRVRAKSYEALYGDHVGDYQALFNRVPLELEGSQASSLATDERIKNYTHANDNSLIALIFQFARYLAISGSRQGGQPLNLQGIWNERMNPPWDGKFTSNINVEMNYWPMNLTGIPECNQPLFDALEDLAEAGSLTAREHYKADGWVLHHNFDIWRATAPVNKSNHGIWPTGSGWLALHIWEHFLFTGDGEHLRRYYPVLEGAVAFYADFLYEDEITGHLISGPSNSPEHGGLVMGPTMDHQIIRSLEFSDLKFLIHILPALPTAWEKGSFEGLRARGGFDVSAAWEGGKLKTVRIKSLTGNPCRLKYENEVIDLKLAKGDVKTIAFGEERAETRFPSVDELPMVDTLPDPFQFFGSDRRVRSKEDWEERRTQILDLVQFYSAGPAFPQTHNPKLENLDTEQVYNGKATHFSVDLGVGPEHAIKCSFEYVMPNTEVTKGLLFYICPKREYAEETIPWRESIIDRGYAFAWVIVGQFNGYKDDGPVKDAFPEVKGNTMMAWVWGVNEVIYYLDETHEISKVIVTGTSRYGKTATMAGAINKRIDLTVPVTGGFGVRRFNSRDQKQPASAFAGRCWSNDVFPTFAGQLNRMPIDQHFVGALIAPRGLLAIMGDENHDKNVGHIEAYEALVPVYEWLRATDKLGIYDHAPRGHGIGEDDWFTILDFADQIFYGKKPESGKTFDQISNPGLVGFEWSAPTPE